MANIVIKDLEKNMELDKEAMKNLTGGWVYWAQRMAMGAIFGPFGGASWFQQSTRIAMGGGYLPWWMFPA